MLIISFIAIQPLRNFPGSQTQSIFISFDRGRQVIVRRFSGFWRIFWQQFKNFAPQKKKQFKTGFFFVWCKRCPHISITYRSLTNCHGPVKNIGDRNPQSDGICMSPGFYVRKLACIPHFNK